MILAAIPNCEAILLDLRAAAFPLYLLIAVAAAALIWQWIEDSRRDRICNACSSCRTKLTGTNNLPRPGPGSGAKG